MIRESRRLPVPESIPPVTVKLLDWWTSWKGISHLRQTLVVFSICLVIPGGDMGKWTPSGVNKLLAAWHIRGSSTDLHDFFPLLHMPKADFLIIYETTTWNLKRSIFRYSRTLMRKLIVILERPTRDYNCLGNKMVTLHIPYTDQTDFDLHLHRLLWQSLSTP